MQIDTHGAEFYKIIGIPECAIDTGPKNKLLEFENSSIKYNLMFTDTTNELFEKPPSSGFSHPMEKTEFWSKNLNTFYGFQPHLIPRYYSKDACGWEEYVTNDWVDISGENNKINKTNNSFELSYVLQKEEGK